LHQVEHALKKITLHRACTLSTTGRKKPYRSEGDRYGQCASRNGRMTGNVCNVLSAVSLASLTAGRALHFQSIATTSLFIATAAAVFFLADTIPVAGIIAATRNGRIWKLWREITGLTLPYFVLSAATAMIVIGVGYYKGMTLLLALLLMYFVWNSFKRYFGHASGRVQAFAARA
jgi:hypothetical protein